MYYLFTNNIQVTALVNKFTVYVSIDNNAGFIGKQQCLPHCPHSSCNLNQYYVVVRTRSLRFHVVIFINKLSCMSHGNN